ncbi:hypothetical protein HYW58_02270 [Candidatus Kaiserbacteria bacterium]|nr:hypothetical protein [Candidatus Kaiserbacteria bacterium]
MEPKFRTSFIPKKTLTTAIREGGRTRTSMSGVFSLLALIVMLGAVTLSVGLFLYEQILESSINRKTETLQRAEAAFEPELIRELVRLDARLLAAKRILNQHIAPSAIFSVLEETTLQSVEFKSFSLTRVSSDKISIAMKGEADNFNGIALQADMFGRNKVIKEPIFSGLNLNSEGRAVFSVTAFIDPSLVSFVSRVSGDNN